MSKKKPKTDRRLIEDWLPIAALSEECVRERRSMTALPPTYYLHVWWARRPLVASRAAIMGALLPPDADHDKFMHMLGIHGDPVESRRRIDEAKRSDERFKGQAYTYKRAFTHSPDDADRRWFDRHERAVILDPTAGGGSIPFESVRSGCTTIANDLNPVAWLVLKATVDFPSRYGHELPQRLEELASKYVALRDERLASFFPPEPESNRWAVDFLWARTIKCPYCGGMVPLSPNWRLDGKGTGVRLVPVTRGKVAKEKGRHIRFEIVANLKEQSPGTVSGGRAQCPFPDCERVIDGDEHIKTQAQAGEMGNQLYAVVYTERKVTGRTKSGKEKTKKTRGYRAPRPEDDMTEKVRFSLEEKMPEWLAKGIVPDEEIPDGHKTGDSTGKGTDKPRKCGLTRWRDMFNPRQLYSHCTSVEVFREIVEELGGPAGMSDLDRAALTYIAFSIDKMLNFNCSMTRWVPQREVVASKFDRHDYAMKWSYAEMAPCVTGVGYDWALKQTGKALKELIALVGHPETTEADNNQSLLPKAAGYEPPPITITCNSADSLGSVEDASVDAVVMDPPYYANVMYAELSDFFYVWLKRTAGLLFPDRFSSYLTDKDREAVANPYRFKDFTMVKGSGGAAKRAKRDYQERMQAIFSECRRVMKPDGIMVLMFTHKATGAWDALAKGLVEAGFVITASWPVSTEFDNSVNIKDRNAARSTIFLTCRPRPAKAEDAATIYWEDVKPKVTEVVRERVESFQKEGIRGVDLYLACFGPALQVFSEHWPMQRGRAKQKPEPAKGAQLKLLEDEEFDPYEVRPEDALMAARAAVKEWRIERISSVKRQAHFDPVTEFFVLAWDAFQSPQFPADEALKLARVVGVSFDGQLRNKIMELKGSNVILWDSSSRKKKGSLGSAKSGCMLDVIHHAARIVCEQNTGAAKEWLKDSELLEDPVLMKALSAVLNVLPAPREAEGAKASAVAGAAADADALEKLRKLAFAKEVPPKQTLLPGYEEEAG